jgi:predicted Na+-dependent transporter
MERWLPLLVLLAGGLGLALSGPARGLVNLGAINVVLALLVVAAGLSIDPSAAMPSRRVLVRVGGALAAGVTVLPLLAWAAGRLVSDPLLRGGVLSAGVAPSEVASVAVVALAGGDAGVAAAILVGSTLLSIVAAGPILQALGGVSVAGPWSVAAGLALVVGAPLLVGLVAGRRARGHPHLPGAAGLASLVLVLVLVWLVGGQVRLDRGYLVVTLALGVFLAGSTAVGWAIATGTGPRDRPALILPVGMRDFAIAAGIAATAFGPGATAPLGVYGLLVLLLGGVATARSARPQARAGS